jgi:hypothetical protein
MRAILEGNVIPRPGQRRICPAVLLLLDAEVAEIGTELVLDLARQHPEALAFVAAVRLNGAEGDPRRRRLVRVAMETVTDLVARREALGCGHYIEDTLRVFLLFTAGVPDAEGVLPGVLQTVHRVAGEFFDQTRLEVHALVILPDLGDPAVRELHYRDAYQRLIETESLGATDQALGHRSHSSFDHRWFVDSRTRTGAHAGRLDEVRSPVAEFLATLLDGRDAGPLAAADDVRAQLRATVRERHAAYSTFGVAVYFHYPNLLLRALAGRAASVYLDGYLGRRSPEAEPLPGQPVPVPESGALVRGWSEEIMGQLAGLVVPALTGMALLRADDAARQKQHRAEIQARLSGWMAGQLREILASGGIPLARGLLHRLSRTEARADPLEDGAASVGALRIDALHRARDLLQLDTVVTRESAARAEVERLAADAASDPGLRAAAERSLQSLRNLRIRLEATLEAASDPDDFEARCLALQPELKALDPPRSAETPAPAPDVRSEAPAERPLGRGLGRDGQQKTWWRKLVERFVPLPAIRPDSANERRDGGEGRGAGGSPAPPAPEPVRAWQVAERLRAVEAIATLLGRLTRALAEHEADVRTAAAHYDEEARKLRRWLTAGSRFYIPAISPADFQAYADQYVSQIEIRLATVWDRRQLARCFQVAPPALGAFDSRLLARLTRLPTALEEAAHAVGGPLLEENLLTVLRKRMQERGKPALREILDQLYENAEPLARPQSLGNRPLIPVRHFYGDAAVYDLLRADPEGGPLLEEAGVVHLETDDTANFVLCSSLHGFSAHELRKLLPFRARTQDRDGSLPDGVTDPVPLDVARIWEGRDTFEIVVMAWALDILQPARDPETGEVQLVFEEFIFPPDLLRVAEELAFSLALRGAEERMLRRVDEALTAPGGIARLRAEIGTLGLNTVEFNTLIDALGEFETRSGMAWTFPIVSEEAPS